jgi:hypothetical protein
MNDYRIMNYRNRIAEIINQVVDDVFGTTKRSKSPLEYADAIIEALNKEVEGLELTPKELLAIDAKFAQSNFTDVMQEIAKAQLQKVLPVVAAREEQARKEERERIMKELTSRPNLIQSNHVTVTIPLETWKYLNHIERPETIQDQSKRIMNKVEDLKFDK